MKLEDKARQCFIKQIDPETSEFECFFHYTDYKIFEAGFIKGAEFEQGETSFVDMDIKTLKEKLNLDNSDISKMFGMSYGSFANSSAKGRYENALCKFYEFILNNK